MSRKSNTPKLIDTAIVGAGPAGLSAALFLGRAGCSVVVFDDGPSRITVVDRVREFIGFDGMAPHEMLSRMRNEVRNYGVPLRAEHVHRVEPRADSSFDIHTPQGITTARTIVLATGVNAPPAKAGGFGLRLKAGSVGRPADYTTRKSSSGSGGLCSSIYLFHTSSVTLPLVAIQ